MPHPKQTLVKDGIRVIRYQSPVKISSQKTTWLKKKRRRLWNRKSYYRSQFRRFAASRKKIELKKSTYYRRKIYETQKSIHAINRQLGWSVRRYGRPSLKPRYYKRRRKKVFDYFHAEEELRQQLKKKTYKIYIIDRVAYRRGQMLDILNAFSEVQITATGVTNTPYFEFIFDDVTDTITIKVIY